MQTSLFIAGLLTLIVGTIHSVLGEILIFRKMRRGGLAPTAGEPLLQERQVRILWASWHIVSVFGFAFGAILLQLSQPASAGLNRTFLVHSIAGAMTISSLLVLFGTKGRHPGWLGLLAVAVLTWLG